LKRGVGRDYRHNACSKSSSPPFPFFFGESNMKFSIGYPHHFDGIFYEALAPYHDGIGELYFPWEGIASGREGFGHGDFEAKDKLRYELSLFAGQGIRLNLLLNGNCYGGLALSESLATRVCDTVDYLGGKFGLSAVTTASPFLAETVKRWFPQIDVRASVNMWIDGISGMRQCLDIFDSFYVKREYNRCPKEIQNQYTFCHRNGKKLYLLANSGCLPNCPYHTFHDNLVAHEEEVSRTKNIENYHPYSCRRLLAKEENRYLLIAGNYIRPEDIHRYENCIDGVKLATRIHPSPITVIGAYLRGHFSGDLCLLTEPGFGFMVAPYILDNEAIPSDFYDKTSDCSRDCQNCGYCQSVLEKIKRSMKE